MRLVIPVIILTIIPAACGKPQQNQEGELPDCSSPECRAEPLPLGATCNNDDECGDGLSCKPMGQGGLCSLDCGSATDCPDKTHCAQSSCAWTTGIVGDACSPDAPCHPGLDCIDAGTGSYCTRKCDYYLPCPEGENARCVKLSQGGNFCLRNCDEDEECAPGLSCLPLTAAPQISTCFAE